jgi:hypothetical protein
MKRRRARGTQKKIVIIAGPNGAGKTTFAEEFLPKEAELIDFLNADLIAKGLSPFSGFGGCPSEKPHRSWRPLCT